MVGGKRSWAEAWACLPRALGPHWYWTRVSGVLYTFPKARLIFVNVRVPHGAYLLKHSVTLPIQTGSSCALWKASRGSACFAPLPFGLPIPEAWLWARGWPPSRCALSLRSEKRSGLSHVSVNHYSQTAEK